MTSKEKKIPKKQFLFLMTRLATAFRENVNKALFEMYYEFLGNEDFDRLAGVVDELISNNKWFPKIAEFNELLYPPQSLDSDYMRYLESSTQRHLDSLKQIEWNSDRSEAIKCLAKIMDMTEPKKPEPTLTGEDADEFERKRKIAKEKARSLL